MQPGGSTLYKFTDRVSISAWAQDAVEQSLAAGIVQGTTATTFAAQDNATRAQAATMLKRMLQPLQFIN
ncbi:S-layer homology domain-containing protein [Paenibacillus allorhizoplanae]|uniref:S-layer homology domain-containing protein n=1 Tax=Paenibacillus allorhizoplanae TaxID=2905648 RepID=UPI003B84671F